MWFYNVVVTWTMPKFNISYWFYNMIVTGECQMLTHFKLVLQFGSNRTIKNFDNSNWHYTAVVTLVKFKILVLQCGGNMAMPTNFHIGITIWL